MIFDHKKDIFSQPFSAIVLKMDGMKYNSDIYIYIYIHAFEYYAKSQSLCNGLRQAFQVPSLETLK